MKIYNYIYLITNKINGKIYIGKHSTDNLNDGYMGSGVLIKKAEQKYGLENFTKEYLAFCDTEEKLNWLECFYIKKYNAKEVGYNLTDGGEGLSGYKGKYNVYTQDNFRPHRVKTLYHYKKEDFDNIYPTMTLREAYDDWMKYKFPHLLEYYKQKKQKEFDQWVLSSKPSVKYKDIKYNKLQTELEALRIKEPSKLAFRKLLDRFNIEYKQKKH